MKKRNLFLSLICSIVLTIALVTVTIVGSIRPVNGNQNSQNGSNIGYEDTLPDQNGDENPGEIVDPVDPIDPIDPVDPTPEHTHTWEEVWSSDETNHWHVCSGCDEISDNAEHVYDNDCDTDCNVCGAVRETSHNFGEAYQFDGDYHWHVCSVCGATSDKVEHVWDDGEITKPATKEENGVKTYTCESCDATKTETIVYEHTHAWEEVWSSDETNHWHACSGCDEISDNAEHVYDNDCDVDCNVCGAIREISHNFGEAYQFDGDYHWQVCSVCGEISDKAEHTYADHTCSVCGAKEAVDPNEGKDGSAENPYVLYDAESFMTILETYGAESKNFVLQNDIDFAGVDYVPLFSKDLRVRFNGTIKGNGYALKNITINVTKENLLTYAYSQESYGGFTYDGRYNMHLGVFGSIENATITGLSIDNINITVAEEVYEYINIYDKIQVGFNTYRSEFAKDNENHKTIGEITVGALAAIAKGSTIEVNVSGKIDADAYIYVEETSDSWQAYGRFEMGGVVARATSSTIKNGTVDISFDTSKNASAFDIHAMYEGYKCYKLGGVVGHSADSHVINMTVTMDVKALYDSAIIVGGVAGRSEYGFTCEDTTVNIMVTEVGSRYKWKGKDDEPDRSTMIQVAGIVSVVNIASDMDNSKEMVNIKNVHVNAIVDIDGSFSGILTDVYSRKYVDGVLDEKTVYINIVNPIINANVNVFRVDGIGLNVTNARVEIGDAYNDEAYGMAYHIKLTGKAQYYRNTLFINDVLNVELGDGLFNNLRVIASGDIVETLYNYEVYRTYAKNSKLVEGGTLVVV